MEVAVRLLGVFLRLLDLVLAPLFWWRSRSAERPPRPPPPLLMRSAIQHAAAIRNGEITSEELVTAYIDRVKEVNPLLNAVVDERYRDAIDDARAVDQKLAEARRAGRLDQVVEGKPLLGVPFTVKESCSLTGLSNAVGCLEFAGRRAVKDGEAVRRVREAGAIPLLVSNTPELCLGWETTNLLRGTTNNPYCLAHTPGGSSGGEAALLASGASAFSVSSDVAGSIRVPAALCRLYGHKPTPGIIPIEGHIPMLSDPQFPRFLTVGPMARWAEDLPLLVDVMAGENKAKLRLDKPVDLSKLRVFYMTEAGNSLALLSVDKSIKEHITQAANYLEKECGSTICEEKFAELEDSVEISVSVFFSMKDIPNLLQDPDNPKREKSLVLELTKCLFGGGVRSLQGLLFALITRNKLFIPASRRAYYEMKAEQLREKLTRTLGVDGVLLYPAWPRHSHAHGRVVVRAAGVMYAMIANVLGLPACTARNLQIIAAPHQDRLCLAVAKKLEDGFGGWQPPGTTT